MGGVAGEEHAPDAPAVGEADVVAVDDRAQDLDLVGADVVAGEQFLQVREITRTQLVDTTRRLAPGLSEPALQQPMTYALAGADGLFVAREIGGDAVDLVALFDLHARVLTTVLAQELAAAEKGPTS